MSCMGGMKHVRYVCEQTAARGAAGRRVAGGGAQGEGRAGWLLERQKGEAKRERQKGNVGHLLRVFQGNMVERVVGWLGGSPAAQNVFTVYYS